MSKSVPEKTVEPFNPVDMPMDLSPEDLLVAHALRTPLTALKSAIDLLCDGGLSPESQHIARIAQRNAARMVELLEIMVLRGSAKS